MKAKDTVMGNKKLQLLGQQYEDDLPTYDLNHYLLLAQAEITFKAVTEELKKQVEGVKANAFSVSLFGDRDHQLKMDAMVSAYEVVLNKIKEMTK